MLYKMLLNFYIFLYNKLHWLPILNYMIQECTTKKQHWPAAEVNDMWRKRLT